MRQPGRGSSVLRGSSGGNVFSGRHTVYPDFFLSDPRCVRDSEVRISISMRYTGCLPVGENGSGENPVCPAAAGLSSSGGAIGKERGKLVSVFSRSRNRLSRDHGNGLHGKLEDESDEVVESHYGDCLFSVLVSVASDIVPVCFLSRSARLGVGIHDGEYWVCRRHGCRAVSDSRMDGLEEKKGLDVGDGRLDDGSLKFRAFPYSDYEPPSGRPCCFGRYGYPGNGKTHEDDSSRGASCHRHGGRVCLANGGSGDPESLD